MVRKKSLIFLVIDTTSGAETFFWRGGEQKTLKCIKFRFAPKLLSICINQKCLVGVGSCTFSSHLIQKGSWERIP